MISGTGKYLDPKVDVVFKKIFGENKDLLKSFLNGVLPLPEDGLIEDLEYLAPEQTPRIPSLKNTIVDVKCRDIKGRIFITEMQLQWSDSFAKRLQFGVSKAYVQQLGKGEDYKSLYPVYGLGIINAVFEKESSEWYHHYKTVNVKDHNKILEGLELVFIELPKFTPTSFKERKLGVLWLRFLKEMGDNIKVLPDEFSKMPELVKALELSKESAYDLEELDAYDKYWDAISVEKTVKVDAYDQGFGEGIEAGELKAKQELALKLLAAGMSPQEVSLLTGIPLTELSA